MIPRSSDVTEISVSKRSFAEADDVTVTPILERHAQRRKEDLNVSVAFNYDGTFGSNLAYEGTPLGSDYVFYIVDNETSLGEEIETVDPMANASEQRITLLARKYATQSMLPEDAARLDILTQRLRNLMPVLSEADLEVMENINDRLDSAGELADRLSEKYG